MRRHILFIFSILLISCSKEIKDGPYIYFSNKQEIADTISPTDTINFAITAIGNSYKVNRVQLFINKSEYFDTSFSAIDSITINWKMNFIGKLNTQNILIQATDENELISSQTMKIYVK
ncbi:MAG: hypothetical protein MJ198_01180 [Bacteroidales bacterium]|nr:hypothetical protein [Bacteroidales bacterium]